MPGEHAIIGDLCLLVATMTTHGAAVRVCRGHVSLRIELFEVLKACSVIHVRAVK